MLMGVSEDARREEGASEDENAETLVWVVPLVLRLTIAARKNQPC